MAPRARVLLDVALLVLLSLLDARDLWFKARWLGGSDSFAFATSETFELAPDALAHAPAIAADGSTTDLRASAWASFLQRCDSVQAFRSKSGSSDGSGNGNSVASFLHALGTKCDIGGSPESPSQLVISSGVRPDSMAWAACTLVFPYRRPPICREGVVADFVRRYQLPAPRVTRAMMAEPMSPAEAELLALLDVISTSMPLSRVVCVEGFELQDRTAMEGSHAHVFGCASPNAFRAAFVGMHAPTFRDLHGNKAGLTLDDASALGMHFSIRQSAVSAFHVVGWRSSTSSDHERPGDRPFTLVHTASTALSCSGFLFNLMILLDAALLLLHATGALEVARVVLLRSFSAPQAEASGVTSTPDDALSRQTLLACSLYRSQPVVLLTVATQLLSWLLLPAHAVVWSRGSSWSSTWHVCLTLLRVWTLVLLAILSAWDAFVSLYEAQAYHWTRATRISSAEVVAIVSTVLLAMRARLLAVVEQKRVLETQRVVDLDSFAPHVRAYSNAFGDEQESQLRSRATGDALHLLYAPLGDVLFWSLLLVALVLAVRYRVNRYRDQRTQQQQVAPNVAAAATAAAGKSGSTGAYARLPIEELLDNPIRAKSLVRSDLHGVEKRCGADTFLHATQLLEHGVVLEKHVFLRTRWGFFGAISANVSTDGRAGPGYQFGGPEVIEPDTDVQSAQPPPSPDARRRRSLRW